MTILLAQVAPLGPTEAGPAEWLPLFPEAAARQAEQVDRVFFAVLGVTGAVLLLVVGLMGWFCLRYRAGSPADRRGQVERTLRYEATWISATLVVFLAGFAWVGAVYFDLYQAPREALRLHVVGKQWMWKVQHPTGQREINELHVPTGRPVKLILTSQDVIHSFYVPAFRVKRDAVPGRYTSLWFEATKPGVYHLFCAEFCGTDHSVMRGRVVVMRPADYEAWLGPSALVAAGPETPGAPAAPLALRGHERFFQLGCNACHLPSARVRAPRLDGLWGRPVALRNGAEVIADEDYVRESILDPNAKLVAGYPSPSLMPTYRGQVSEDDLRDLIEFVRSLRDGWWTAPSFREEATK